MYVRPQHEGKPLTLGVSGKLWRDALVMFDRETRTLWSQVLGQAVAGPLEGIALEEVPSQVTTWKAWKVRHPDTLVLVKPPLRRSSYSEYHSNPGTIGVLGSENPDGRLPVKMLVFGFEVEDTPVAVPLVLLEDAPVLGLVAHGQPLMIVSPPEESVALAYRRVVDGQTFDFEASEHDGSFALRDRQTGSIWSWESGESLAGELVGRRLEPYPGISVFWGVWARYHPGSEVVGLPP